MVVAGLGEGNLVPERRAPALQDLLQRFYARCRSDESNARSIRSPYTLLVVVACKGSAWWRVVRG